MLTPDVARPFRAFHDLAELTKSPPEGVSVGPKGDNLFEWEVLIVGPAGTLL